MKSPSSKLMRWIVRLVLSAVLLIPVVRVSRAEGNSSDSIATHYWLTRPVASKSQSTVDRGLPYGWTRNGRSPIHHGVDIPNGLNGHVVAAADGTVYFAGDDSSRVFGPQPNFYGHLIVIQHDLAAPEGGQIYTLYGHLNMISVQAGQHVSAGQLIGGVGMTGIAVWYHLHFEVRVGNGDDYNATRNPELWYAPKPGTGTLVGRMVDADGGLAMGIRYTMSSRYRTYPGWTYADPSMHNDPAYGENFTIGDLPAACYSLRVKDGKGGYAYDQPVCIKGGQTVFVEVKLAPF